MVVKLQEKINNNLILAMREKQEVRLGVLRMISAAFHKREIEKRGGGGENILSDEECLTILRSELKKRKESRGLFLQGGRNDLAKKEMEEISIIAEYLPPELSREEIESVVRNVITKTGATSIKQMGLIMKEVSQELKGNVDGSLVSSLVREILLS